MSRASAALLGVIVFSFATGWSASDLWHRLKETREPIPQCAAGEGAVLLPGNHWQCAELTTEAPTKQTWEMLIVSQSTGQLNARIPYQSLSDCEKELTLAEAGNHPDTVRVFCARADEK